MLWWLAIVDRRVRDEDGNSIDNHSNPSPRIRRIEAKANFFHITLSGLMTRYVFPTPITDYSDYYGDDAGGGKNQECDWV